ncbi:MAG: DUF262 domain-containing protein [Coleofasciculus sp. C1-SOL-03]|uniref:DUF262 domain-containing protein n=1 Tax=Coleofasciculus sp. C1-SOL-03 TaxID=3069522 RepID=UPI003303DD20
MTEPNNLNLEFTNEDSNSDEATWIDLEEDDIEPEDEVITTPFDPSQIRVDTRPMTIDLVLKRIKFDEINLAPDFQRNANIWNDKAKSRLIESILIRIPLPAFYMDATNEDKWLVIDGLQRLSTLKQFVIDKTLRLNNLEFLTNLNSKNYDDLPRNYQRRIDETVLTVYLIEKGTPSKVKYNIFRRINTGGLPLSPQELRHAINPGSATKFLDKLAKSKEFKQATRISKIRQERMDDHEFVLGFVAFLLTPYKDYNVKEGRDYFLNEAMAKTNKMKTEELKDIEYKFLRSLKAAYSIFEENAFRKIIKNQEKKQPLNKALFEVWSVTLSKLNDQELEILKQRKHKLIQKFVSYSENDTNFFHSISQASEKVSYRFEVVEKIVQTVLS